MSKLAIVFGGFLIGVGLWGRFGTGTTSPTALIPAVFGLVLLSCGLAARNEARRKLAMHIAVAIALIGFLGTIRGLMQFPALLTGGEVARPDAVVAQALTGIICLIFTVMGTKSFLDARAQRAAATK